MRTDHRYIAALLTQALAVGSVLGSVLGLAACSFNADYDGTRYSCADSGECPDGFACFRGECVAGLPDLDECGSMAVAALDFDTIDLVDFDYSSMWDYWIDDPGTMTTVAGQLVVEFPDEVADVGGAFELDKIFPREGAEVTVEIVERSADGTSETYLLLEDRNGDHVEFYEAGGRLMAMLHTDTVEAVLAEFDFDPAVHRFWRIREQDGQFVFATSGDGGEWTEHASTAGAEVDGWLGAGIGIWKSGAGGGPARLVIDNWNGGASSTDFCPTIVLRDDFDDGVRAPDWRLRDSNGCTPAESDGRLGFAFPNAGGAECSYRSITRFDLRASTITVEAPLQDTPGLEHCLKLHLPWYQDIEFELFDGELRGEKSLTNDSGAVFAIPFDPVAHRYWRFRGEDGTVYWELSGDGVEWQVMASHQDPDMGLEQIHVDLVGDTNVGELDNVGVGFDNLNIDP